MDEKKYKEALERAKEQLERAKVFDYKEGQIAHDIRTTTYAIFPELAESADEIIRKALVRFHKSTIDVDGIKGEDILAWLEKQGNTNKIVNKKKIAPDILRGAAINLITWIDYNSAEGNMCLSNMECKRIEDALVNGDWGKIYAYMKKKLEKQGEQSVIIDIDKMVSKYANTKETCTNGLPVNCQIRAYRQGINDALRLSLNLEKKGEQKPAWSDEDEKHIDSLLERLEGMCKKGATFTKTRFAISQDMDWLKSLKDRIGG